MERDFESIVRVGVDLGQSRVQVHAVDLADRVVVARQLHRADFLEWCTRLPADCMVAMEAGSASHYWGRTLSLAGLDARLIAASFVAPYRLAGKTGKSDSNDAEAICEAAARPRMRFVPVKTSLQQSWLAIHALRDGYIKERRSATNRIRSILVEFGIVLPRSTGKVRNLMPAVLTDKDNVLPPVLKAALRQSFAHFQEIERRIDWCDKQVERHVKADVNAKRAMGVWGIGVLGASALAATCGDLRQFKNGRQFGAWMGLVPSQHSSGGNQRLGRITKHGDSYLRKLLVIGARSALRVARKRDDPTARWASQVLGRVGWPKASVALANKNARILWATLAKNQDSRSARLTT